jgi:hypothetical protein
MSGKDEWRKEQNNKKFVLPQDTDLLHSMDPTE